MVNTLVLGLGGPVERSPGGGPSAMVETRYVVAGVVLLVVLAAAGVAALRGGEECVDCYFIIYGQDWCPYCQAMEEFVVNNYGADRLEFRDLDVPEWEANFLAVVKDLNLQYGIPIEPKFPLTGVLVRGEDGGWVLAAIIQGAVTDREAIAQVVSRADPPGEIAVLVRGQVYVINIENDRVIVEAFTPQG